MAAASPIVGGVDWSYHRFGNASAGRPPLLLIHGLGGTSYDWPLPVLQEWAAGRELVAFDNPRAGASSACAGLQRGWRGGLWEDGLGGVARAAGPPPLFPAGS